MTTWFMREFAIVNNAVELEDEPAELGNEPVAVSALWNMPEDDAELGNDFAETMELRNSLAVYLSECLPHIDKDWQSVLPYNLHELEMLGVHPSRAINLQ